MTVTIKKEFRSVNSKELANAVCDFLDSGIEDLGVSWASESHRAAFAQIVEDLLLDLQETGKIEQMKVVFDRRNNPPEHNEKGLYHFELQYKQRHCVNITKIIYHIDCGKQTTAVVASPDFII